MTPTPTPKAPAKALRWCQQVTRQHSQTFYLGSLLYPPEQRLAVWAVYAACRAGDDITDDLPPDEARPALAAWWAEIEAAYRGEWRSDMGEALAWAAARYEVPLSAFAELHAGFQMDLAGQEYKTLDELLLYCRRVGGVIGLMIAPIGGYAGGEATLRGGLALGEAMQLTNILRDVGEDLGRGRLYLPAEWLQRYGVRVEDLQAGRMTPEYRRLLAALIELTRERYTLGRRSIGQLHGRARYGVAAAAKLYGGILDELEAAHYGNLQARASVALPRKLWLTLVEVHEQLPFYDRCPLTLAQRGYKRTQHKWRKWQERRSSRSEMRSSW